MTSIVKSYSELQKLETFKERFDYLRMNGIVGESTFGFDRYLNQALYRSRRWLQTRDKVIIRDNGCDLALTEFPINGKIIIHHINPITMDDVESGTNSVFDLNFLICVSYTTHLAIHYGDENLIPKPPVNRRPGDTTPWRIL